MGLGTRLGVLGATITALATALAAVLPNDQSGEVRLFATLATVLTVATLLGRMLQAAALALAPAVPGAGVAGDDDDALEADPLLPELEDVQPHDPSAIPPDVGDREAVR